MPHPGGPWADPEMRAQRCAEVVKEQQRLTDHYADATEQQEARLNAEERKRFDGRS